MIKCFVRFVRIDVNTNLLKLSSEKCCAAQERFPGRVFKTPKLKSLNKLRASMELINHVSPSESI